MFSINSHYGALQPLAIVGMLHVNLLPAPLPLELVVEALPGLLTVEAEAVLLPHHLQELLSVGLQKVHLGIIFMGNQSMSQSIFCHLSQLR